MVINANAGFRLQGQEVLAEWPATTSNISCVVACLDIEYQSIILMSVPTNCNASRPRILRRRRRRHRVWSTFAWIRTSPLTSRWLSVCVVQTFYACSLTFLNHRREQCYSIPVTETIAYPLIELVPVRWPSFAVVIVIINRLQTHLCISSALRVLEFCVTGYISSSPHLLLVWHFSPRLPRNLI